MANRKKAAKDLRSRRFTDEQRQHALALVASGMKRGEVATAIGTTTNSIWLWRKAAVKNGTMPVVVLATCVVRRMITEILRLFKT
jgi:transposase-like protein